ncbi:MAG: hypothetical protein ABGY41_09095 [Candidatus Poribacteria bacterium]
MSFRSAVLPVWLAALILGGCGEARHVLIESLPVLITPSAALPKNLVSPAQLVIASPEGDVEAAIDRITVTLRDDRDGGTMVTVTASGTIHARVPANILHFRLLLAPADPGAAWVEGEVAADVVQYPRQLAAGDEGKWHWQLHVVTDDRIATGVEVRTRLIYEVLL